MNTSIPHIRHETLDTNRDEILDVRVHVGKEQIRGALRYDPGALLGADDLVLPLAHDRTIAVYGDSPAIVDGVVDRLREGGYEAAVLDGGIEAWIDDGLPTEEITLEQPVPR